MAELTANPSYVWDDTIRELKQDDGSDLTLDHVDIIGQELLDKTYHLKALATTATADIADNVTALGTKLNAVKASFDFAVDGGAAEAHGLGVTIPDNAIVTKAYVDVLTTFQSATGPDNATIALHVEGANDLVSAVAINSATDWDEGLRPCIPVGTVATMIKTTAARELTLTIAVEAITAGALNLFVEYVQSD